MALQHFLNLPGEKRKQILEAGLQEFITYGYDLASTNRIVQTAGISKGVLFKYFSNKEALFLYLFEHCAQIAFAKSGLEELEALPEDFFDAMKVVAWKEFEMYQAHPLVYGFMRVVAQDMQHPVHLKAFHSIENTAMATYQQVVTQLLVPRLRTDVPVQSALEMMNWAMEGLKTKLLRIAPSLLTPENDTYKEQVLAELDVLFELLKHGMYKR